MEESISVKVNTPEVLERQVFNRAKKKKFGFIVLSSATDPYLHFEKDLNLTRQNPGADFKASFPCSYCYQIRPRYSRLRPFAGNKQGSNSTR